MKKIKLLSKQVLLLFALLGAIFVPFSFENLAFQYLVTKFLFDELILLLIVNFDLILVTNTEITSDSSTLYLLLLVLFVIALFLVIIFYQINFFKKNKNLFFSTIPLFLNYYLALVMLKYGFDKIFKTQFYLPEPNTLYTPLGMLDKDILFWSTMGTSFSYNVFMGLIEVLPALLLCYKKTRVLGLLILSGVLLNVVFINFSFDISVKMYSLFLFFLCVLLLLPFVKQLFKFLVLNKSSVLKNNEENIIILKQKTNIIVKLILFLFLFTETLLPHLQSTHFNDDNVPRNKLHGVYEITKTQNLNIKRFFIHRYNYLIFQYNNETMEDFTIEINEIKKQMKLTNIHGKIFILQYKYITKSKSIELYSEDLDINIKAKSLAWQELPALKQQFHWTVDQIK